MKRLLKTTLKLFAPLMMLFTLTGCDIISADSFVFHGAKVVEFDLDRGAKVEVTIENTSTFSVDVVGGELTAYYKGEPIGSVYIKNPVTIPRKSTSTVTLDVGFKFDSPMAALKALFTLTSSPDNITISGYGEGKVWMFHKRFEKRDVPLSKFIAIFGDVTDYISF